MDGVRDSYDRVARRYADELSGELVGKPLDRALLRAFVELVADVEERSGPGSVADLGCGPGHVAAYLSSLGVSTVGIDLSPAMVATGAARFPEVAFRVGSLLELPAVDGEFLGAIAFYSIIHLPPADRPAALVEMRRVIRPGGWLLLAFHIEDAQAPAGAVRHIDEWWDEPVDLEFYYLDPAQLAAGLAAAGFVLVARTDREPWPGAEHASRRCYLLCRRP